nr:hypothetical protein [uncultured Rhodococcus sp.]
MSDDVKTVDEEVVKRLAIFRDMLAGDDNDERIVRSGILYGSAYAILDDAAYKLREAVANEFGLDANQDVFMVGSAKLGFSIAPRKRFIPFHDRSDIDLAIVSEALFKRVWHELDEYRAANGRWSSHGDFANYLARGWIRPDKLPRSKTFDFSNDWWSFFKSLQNAKIGGGVKINAGIYHDMKFLVRYQERAVSACRGAVRMGSANENIGDE